MYTQLLEAVLALEADPATRTRSQGSLADVIRLRHLIDRHSARTDPRWALQAVADQLAYDAALVRLARTQGIVAGPDTFANPERGRASLEDSLIAQGFELLPRTEQESDSA
jgi:hypothetical protein